MNFYTQFLSFIGLGSNLADDYFYNSSFGETWILDTSHRICSKTVLTNKHICTDSNMGEIKYFYIFKIFLVFWIWKYLFLKKKLTSTWIMLLHLTLTSLVWLKLCLKYHLLEILTSLNYFWSFYLNINMWNFKCFEINCRNNFLCSKCWKCHQLEWSNGSDMFPILSSKKKKIKKNMVLSSDIYYFAKMPFFSFFFWINLMPKTIIKLHGLSSKNENFKILWMI